jgi:hypothetical protein
MPTCRPTARTPARYAGDAAGVAISNGDRWLAVTTLAWIDRCAFRPEYRAADRNSANNAEITRRIIDRDTCMRFLSYAYRISSNFVFLALVYYSLNFLEKYQQRAIVAILVLVYSAMRAASALRSFYFFQKIERLEGEARRLAGLTGEGPAAASQRRQIVTDVSGLRRAGEMNSYIDLLFLALIVLLCISKIVTE